MISIIIPTFNNAASLSRTLESLKMMDIPVATAVELLVVDNNCTDNTADVIKQFAAEVPPFDVKYCYESEQGSSAARNKGIKEASGSILAFTDDDVIVKNDWAVMINKIFKDPSIACAGGKILPKWEIKPPEWIDHHFNGYLALIDYGEKAFQMLQPELWTANLAVRKSVVDKYGNFPEHMGHLAGRQCGGEDVYFVERLLEAGEKVMYCPEMLVHHCIPKKRMQKRYFRSWALSTGERLARNMELHGKRHIFGVPYYMFRRALLYSGTWLVKTIRRSDSAYHSQLLLLQTLTFIWFRVQSSIGLKS